MNNKDIKQKVFDLIIYQRQKNEMAADLNFKRAMQNEKFKNEYSSLKDLKREKIKISSSLLTIKNNDNLKMIKQQIDKINLRIDEKKKNLENILNSINMSSNDLITHYTCKVCKDKGIINGKYCQCFYKLLNDELTKKIGIKINPQNTFINSNFDLFEQKENIKLLYSKIENWCENLRSSEIKTIILSGNTGVGKTYLTECICNKLINKQMSICFYSSFSLNNLFYKYHTSFEENRMGILDDVLNCDLLVVDDFGSEPKMKNSEEYFYSLFNERLIKNLNTIITTNLSPLQILDRYGERVFSRLNNKKSSICFKIENKDLRLKKCK